MFDFTAFFEVSVAGLPLIWVVLGLVTWLAKLGLHGKAKLVASLVVGLLLGIGFQFSKTGMPADFSGWFMYIVYGLALGLFASGIYDTGKALIGGETIVSFLSPDEGDEDIPV